MSEVAITITADGKAVVSAAKQAGNAIQSLGSQAEQAASHLQAAGKAGSNLAASSAAAKQAGEAMQSLGSQAGQTASQAQAAGKATADMANRAGMSAKEMAAATRGIPAQFTDIVTSLASGQAPLTVLLQQGGQLKDQFHGMIPAIKAVGGYVAGLVNPFTVAAASVGVLYLAYQQGRKETELLNQALLKTGNITGTTTGQLNEMAKALGHGEFTRGAAAAALAEIAGTGAIASKSLQGFTQTALDMQRYVGTPVEETAKVFKSLGDEPVKASLKLNESLHYLTRTQYEQIKTLEEHSKKTEAAALAQKIAHDALQPQIDASRANLNALEISWSAVEKMAKKAWTAMKGVVGPETGEDRLAAARKKLEEIQGIGSWRITDEVRGIRAKQAQDEVTYLERVIQATRDGAAAQASFQKQQEAGIKWSQEGEKYLTKELQLKKQISQIEALGQEAGLGSAEIEARVALARQDYDKSIAAANAESLVSAARGNATRYSEYYKQELESFRLSTSDYLEKIRDLESRALQVERRAVAGEKTTTAEDRIKKQSRLAELDAQIREVGDKYQRAIEDEASKNQQILARLSVEAGKALDPLTQAGQNFVSQYGAIMRRAGADGNEAILEAGRSVWETMADKAQFDSAKKLYEDLFARLTSELDAVRQAADLDGGLFSHIDAAGKADEIKSRLVPSIDEALVKMRQFAGTDLVNDKAVVEAEANVKKLTASANPYFKKMADSIENSLTDALMRGFESGKGFGRNLVDTIKNLFGTMVLRPVISAIISPVSGALMGSMGLSQPAQAGQSPAAGGGVNLLGVASGAKSAYDLLTKGISSSIEAGFSKLMGSSFGESLGLAQPVGYTTGSGVQYGLNGAGSTMGSAMGMAGGALASYAISKGLSGGYQVGSGKLVDAITLAAGAYFGPIAGVAAGVFNRAFGRKLADSGLQGTFGGEAGFAGSSYQFYKGGWLRSDKTKTAALDPAVESGLSDQFKVLQVSTGLMATTLGLSTDAVRDFTAGIRVSFQGLTDEQVQIRLKDEFAKISDQMATATLATTDYTRTGETATQTLQRLSGALSTINGSFDTLGLTLYQASLKGGDMASQLVDLFGGLDGLKNSATSYYQNYYTDQERAATALRQVHDSLSSVNLAMPATTAEFRAMVEAQDLSTESGRGHFATLMQLSPAFHDATTAMDAYTKSLRDQASSIDDYIARLKGGKDGLATPAQQLESLRGSYVADLGLARAGDATALGRITASAQSYVDAQKTATASSSLTQAVIDQVVVELTGLNRGIGTQISTAIPQFASGGYHEGGWAIVGEKGPELARFNAPAQIYNASQTTGLLSNGALLQEIRALHKTIADMSQELEALRVQQTEETRALINSNAAIQSQAADRVVKGVASAGERQAWVKGNQPVIA